jgi:hypothetical protein
MTVAKEMTGIEDSGVRGEFMRDAILAGFILNAMNMRQTTVLETRGKRQPWGDVMGRRPGLSSLKPLEGLVYNAFRLVVPIVGEQVGDR